MVKAKSKPGAAVNVRGLSATMWQGGITIITEMIKAGKSNLMQGYASTILVTDFLYKAGITSQEAKDRVFLLGDMIQVLAGITDAAQIVGLFTGGAAPSPFAPTMNTNVEQTGILGAAENAAALAGAAAKVLPK
jgi:hypothetical protein